MKDAFTLAFAEQLAPAVRDIACQVELHGTVARTRFTPVLAALALYLALGTGSAVLWIRWVAPANAHGITVLAVMRGTDEALCEAGRAGGTDGATCHLEQRLSAPIQI